MTRTLDLAVIGGDGIGPEVTAQAIRVLTEVLRADPDGAGVELRTTDYALGAAHWHETGEVLSDETLEKLRGHDGIVLGAVGDPSTPSGLLERGLLLKLRFAFDHYVNLRPSRLYPGVPSPLADPGEVDFVVVREGTEGLYAGNGGSLRTGTAQEVATEVSLNTDHGVRRVVRYAFDLARRRRGHLTLVHKHNVLVHAGGLWRRVVEEVGAEYPDVTTDYQHVDAATIFLVTDPSRFDVIVTDNLFGDILTDEAGAITGGIGLAASANLNVTGEFPSMFEPVHGSAPDIAGQHKADPRAAILSMALLLDHHDLPAAAKRVRAAVEADVTDRAAAADTHERGAVRETRTTEEIADAVLARLTSDAAPAPDRAS